MVRWIPCFQAQDAQGAAKAHSKIPENLLFKLHPQLIPQVYFCVGGTRGRAGMNSRQHDVDFLFTDEPGVHS